MTRPARPLALASLLFLCGVPAAAPAADPPPATRPAAVADAATPDAAAAARRRTAVDGLTAARASAAKDPAVARKALAEAATAAAAGLAGDEPEVAATLRQAVDDAVKAADDAAAADALRAGVGEALADLTFEPKVEAEMPAGFPPPGPLGRVVVKAYPPYRMARTAAGDGQNSAFWTLFLHIKTNDVAMTAPVEMTFKPAADGRMAQADMAFLYGNPDAGRAGPQGKVEVVDVPAVTVASVGVRGDYTPERLKAATAKVDAWLAANPAYERAGDVRYMGYNSPMVPAAKRFGEVQVPVRKRP